MAARSSRVLALAALLIALAWVGTLVAPRWPRSGGAPDAPSRALVEARCPREHGTSSCGAEEAGRGPIEKSLYVVADHELDFVLPPQGVFAPPVAAETRRLEPDARAVGRIACEATSPDRRCVAVGRIDGSIAVSEASTGKGMWELEDAHSGMVLAIGFSRDGTTVGSSGYGRSVRLWDAVNGEPIGMVTCGLEPISDFLFAFEDRALLCASRGGEISIVGLSSGTVERTLRIEGSGRCRLALSRDGGRLAACSAQGRVRVWDARTWSPLGIYQEEVPSSLAFSVDGEALLTGNAGGRLTLWDIPQGRPRWTSWRHSGAVYDLDPSPDGRSVLSHGEDGQRETSIVDGLPLDDGAVESRFTWGRVDVRHRVALAPKCYGPRVVCVLDLAGGTAEGRPTRSVPTSAAFSPDGSILVTGAADSRVIFWDPATGRRLRSVETSICPVTALVFSKNGRRLAVGGHGPGVLVMDFPDAKDRRECKGLYQPTPWIGFDERRNRVFALGSYGDCVGWDLASNPPRVLSWEEVEVWRSDPSRPLDGATASVDIVDGVSVHVDTDGSVEVLEASTGMAWRTPPAYMGRAVGWEHRPTERVVVSVDESGVVLWTDTLTGAVRASLGTTMDAVRCMALSPDGRRVALGRVDGSMDVWEAPEEGLRPEPLFLDASVAECWRDLGEEDKAWRAAARLATTPEASLGFLAARLLPKRSTEVDRLVAELDADDLARREAATEGLILRGEDVLGAMARLIVQSPSPEVRARAAMVIQRFPAGIAEACALRERRSVVALIWMGTPESWDLLDRLAAGEAGRAMSLEVRAALRTLAPSRRPASGHEEPTARAH